MMIYKKKIFLLCVQTPFQKEMMRCFANSMIFADSTHSTTQYDFLLTTFLVIDDFGEGIPVAFAISNREDADILTVFMRALKVANGGQDYDTKVFMSDLANTFYNAWCSVFSTPDRRLYCTWHVDKAWSRKVLELASGKEQQTEIYAYVSMLRMEVEEGQFRRLLQEFEEYTKVECPQFHTYFIHNYRYIYIRDKKFKFWAACFRIGCIANTYVCRSFP